MHRQQKIYLTAIFTVGGLYVALLYIFPITITVSALDLNLGILADESSGSSVTIVSIIRLIYLIKGHQPITILPDYTKLSIWTNVEANVSIICGQYKTLSLLLYRAEIKPSNI